MEYLDSKHHKIGDSGGLTANQAGEQKSVDKNTPVKPKMASFKVYKRDPSKPKIKIDKPKAGLSLSRISVTEKILFLDNLSTMLKAGLALAPALQTLQEEIKNKFFKKVVDYLSRYVESGQILSKGMEQYPKIFSEMIVATIAVGENTGRLAESAHHLAAILKAQKKLRSKVFSALMYPTIVLIALVVVSLFLALAVFPQLIDMFISGGVELPFVLVAVNQANFILTNYYLYLIGGLVGLIILWKVIFKLPKPKYGLHLLLLKIPFVGRIISELALTRFAGNLHALLAAGLSIVKSLEIVARTLNNLKYRKETIQMSIELQKGISLEQAMRNRPNLFPSLAVQLCQVGETTGELENILTKVTEYYEEKVNTVLGNLSVILEPVLLVLVGVAVAFIAISVITPMYQLTNSFAN